jgi:cell division protein FtsB
MGGCEQVIFHRCKTFIIYLFRRENWRALVVFAGLAFFTWFAVFGDQGLYQLHRTARLKAQLKKEIARLKDKIAELKDKKALLNDPKHLELVIRQELGYVKPGEVVFQPIGEAGQK